MKYAALIIFILVQVFGVSSLSAYAQNTSAGTAVSIPIIDKNAKDGHIIISTPIGFGLSSTPYATNMYGVLTQSPAVYLQNSSDATLKPVTSSGKVYVLVSSINGNIKKNDFITTSTIAGVGQKATKNGIVLGTALEDYNNSNQKITAKILVAVNPHFNASFVDIKTDVLEMLRNASDPSTLTPLTSLRYLIAAIIVLISFGLGFVFFGRVTTRGIEAMGRNPLASRTIQLNLIFNFFLLIFTIIVGLGVGYLILVL